MVDILRATQLTGTVSALLINDDKSDLSTVSQQSVIVSYAGFDNDAHAGLTRPACSRVKAQYPEGTEIRNTRQVSILSVEELKQIATTMELEDLSPEWVGANLVIEGLPDVSALPPSSRLIFSSGVSLVVDMENAPCRYPGDIIEKHHAGKRHLFAKAAQGLRGVTAWVERPGTLTLQDTLTLHVPTVRPYNHG